MIAGGCSHAPNMAPKADGPSTLRLAQEKGARHASRDSVLALYDEAIREYREGRADYDPVELFSDAGQYYFRSGDDSRGAEYMREAADSLISNPPATQEERTNAAKLLGNLGNLYRKLGMEEEALEFNARAIAMAEGLDPSVRFHLWRMRAVIHREMRSVNTDSVMGCYNMAISHAGNDSLRMVLALALASRLDFMADNPDIFDKRKIGDELKRIEKLPWRDEQNLTMTLAAMGYAYCAIDEDAKGIRLLEEALAKVRQRNDILMVQWLEKTLCHAYSKTGRSHELAAIYPELEVLNDTLLDREKLSAVVGAEFKYRAREKEREAEMLRQQEADNRRLIALQWAVMALGLILLCVLITSIFRRNRRNRMEKQKMQEEMSELLNRQVQYNSTIDNLHHTIENLNTEISARDSGEEIRQVLTELKPSVLNGNDETAFRRAFARLHPHFIAELREEFPSLTVSDELLCMLIYLKQSTDDVAYSLGISRQSVNTARYRLRKRLNLAKETDLDTFLTTRRS